MSKTVWILDEIGKEKPITVGIVVDDGKIERVKDPVGLMNIYCEKAGLFLVTMPQVQ